MVHRCRTPGCPQVSHPRVPPGALVHEVYSRDESVRSGRQPEQRKQSRQRFECEKCVQLGRARHIGLHAPGPARPSALITSMSRWRVRLQQAPVSGIRANTVSRLLARASLPVSGAAMRAAASAGA